MSAKIDRKPPPNVRPLPPAEEPPAQKLAVKTAPTTGFEQTRPADVGVPQSAATTVAPSQSAQGLWGPKTDAAKVAALRSAMETAPQGELAKALGESAKGSPREYRAALRDTLEVLLHDASRLQRHLTLLDIDGNGQITMGENYRSLRQLGMSPSKAVLIGGASQLALVLSARDSIGTTIPVANADRGQHETVHTGAMDPEADLTAKLDEMMAEDVNGDGYLDLNEIGNLLDKRAAASDANAIAKVLIKAANKGEFAALFALMGGKMSREDLRDFYTGSLFYSLLPPDALAQRLVLLREKAG